jgi:hypothetical protein
MSLFLCLLHVKKREHNGYISHYLAAFLPLVLFTTLGLAHGSLTILTSGGGGTVAMLR